MSFESDRQILRELGKTIAEIAALPMQQQTKRQWVALNGLRPERPMFMIDQIPWHEMNTGGELDLLCEDELCRGIEQGMRRTLYKWNHMRDDSVVEAAVNIPKAIMGLDFGISANETVLALDAENDVISHHYADQLQNWDDLEKIKTPEIRLDEQTTARRVGMAHEIFDGILEVRPMGYLPNFAPWDRISQWRGVENPLMDLVDRPDFIHATMERITTVNLRLLDQLEEKGLLAFDLSLIHCTGAWSDELPAVGFDPLKPRARDIWTSGMAQMFSSVSPAMHEEFEIEYAKRWYERFGLVYYGCCEPLDRKIGIIRKLPHVRKISMSPWSHKERGAEAIGGDFVFSNKPNPALLVATSFTTEHAENELRATYAACKKHGCPVEFILKDISTVQYEPQRLWQWAQMARRFVENA